MITAEELVIELKEEEQKYFKLATVIDLFENETAKIQFDGEDVPSEKQYAYLASYIPSIDDKVLLGALSGTYIILGKVNYDVSPDVEEEIDRYLFNLKKVIMEKGLSVTGITDLEELTVDDIAVDGDLGVSGTIMAQEVSATGKVKGSTAEISGEVTAGSASIDGGLTTGLGAAIGGALTVNSNFMHKGLAIGFFNRSAAAGKRSVSKITASDPDNKTIKDKLNELIDAFQWYNLV